MSPFSAYADLLRSFVAQRGAIVGRIEALLNAQRKPFEYLQDVPLLRRRFGECFPLLSATPRELEEARLAGGFNPRAARGLHNDIVDPAEMMSRAFFLWRQTRWPGNHGRGRYAETLFNLYLLRLLMLLGLRLWDIEPASTGERLMQLQGVLDSVWGTSPPDQPVFVRDVRWLIPLAQSPTTDELQGYFAVAEHVAQYLPAQDRLEVQRASAVTAGGHLRSQLRHVATQKGVSLDDHDLLLDTRRSNALDLALLLQALVPLLEAYEQALLRDDEAKRLEWGAAICQALSPDPELFLNRRELLGAYSAIEYLFVSTDAEGRCALTPTGERHLRLVAEYDERVRRMARPLFADVAHFRPAAGRYSPYGVLYGFSSQLLEHMALKSLQADADTRFCLENVFTAGGPDELAWVSGWRKLPHVPKDVLALFEYPQRFAEDVFARIERALQRAATGDAPDVRAAGRLLIAATSDRGLAPELESVPAMPVRYRVSSDRAIVAAGEAAPCDPAELLHGRTEGEFVVSYPTAGGWVGISKDVLTDVVGAGRTARIHDLPAAAAAALRLTCRDLVAPAP